MPEPLILHGYANSPFAEKIRLMLGYLDLPWRALTVPPQPPRPSLDPVLGGYRRIPVLQIGADYICDTRLIALELAQRSNRPELAPDSAAPALAEDAVRFDTKLFRAGVLMIPNKKLLWASVRTAGFGVFKLLADRKAMAAAGGFKTDSMRKIAEDWLAHLAQLEQRLHSGFLGGQSPNAADFSAYHTLWFARDFARSLDLSAQPNLRRWYDAMTAIGHGSPSPILAGDAFEIARQAAPRAWPESRARRGERVTIAPTDYARDGSTGRLVYADDTRLVIARETARCGVVHVHFPQAGFALQAG